MNEKLSRLSTKRIIICKVKFMNARLLVTVRAVAATTADRNDLQAGLTGQSGRALLGAAAGGIAAPDALREVDDLAELSKPAPLKS